MAACKQDNAFSSPFQVVPTTAGTDYFSGMSVTADGLSAIVAVANSSTTGKSSDLKLYTRTSRAVAFGNPTNLPGAGNINTDVEEQNPRLTRDGLKLYFDRGGLGWAEVYLSSRASVGDDFGAAFALDKTTINADDYALSPWVSADNKTIYWSLGDATRAIYLASITPSGFANVAAVSNLSNAYLPVLTDDMLTIYISSTRPDVGSSGDVNFRIWKMTRTSAILSWSTPVVLPELNDSSPTFGYDVSPDGCILYYSKGGLVYQAQKSP